MTNTIAAAREILTTTFGSVRDSEIFQTWGPTLVIGATCDGVGKIVLKASTMQDVRIEARTSRLAAAQGVLVPTVLSEGFDDRLPGGHWFAMERLRGIRWHDTDWTGTQHLAMLCELACHLANVHSVVIDGYGPLNLDGAGTFDSWSGWLESGFRRSTEKLIDTGYLSRDFRESLMDVLADLSPALDRRPSVLVHGDLGDGEVYVDPDSGTITGLVDWGASVGGDPFYEFARFVAGGPVDDPRPGRFLEPLRRLYDAHGGGNSVPEQDLEQVYHLHNALLNAEWSLKEAPEWIGPLYNKAQVILAGLR